MRKDSGTTAEKLRNFAEDCVITAERLRALR